MKQICHTWGWGKHWLVNLYLMMYNVCLMRHKLINQSLPHPDVWHICLMRYDYATALQLAWCARLCFDAVINQMNYVEARHDEWNGPKVTNEIFQRPPLFSKFTCPIIFSLKQCTIKFPTVISIWQWELVTLGGLKKES